MSACGQVDVVPLGSGARYVRGCPLWADDQFDGVPMCRTHADDRRYERREFQRRMADATRHTRQVGYGVPGAPGSGVHCSCGEFVPDGQPHPFGVPERLLSPKGVSDA